MTNYHEPFLIVGMHRSGTSCLTGCLQMAGMNLGNVNTYAKYNIKGNRENRDIMILHDIILDRAGCSWDNPPISPVLWTKNDKDKLLDILEGYRGVKTWGVKDPRTLLLYEGWQALTKPRFIGTFRHPNEVAASLIYRSTKQNNTMDLNVAYDLWLKYNQKLISLYDDQPFDILRYDVEPEVYKQKLSIIASNIGLDCELANGFREDGLHNQRKVDGSIPDHLRETWNALNDISI